MGLTHNDIGSTYTIAVTGRAHCQRQVAFFFPIGDFLIASVDPPSRESTDHGLNTF